MKQQPLCSDCEDKITPMDLPIPSGLKEEYFGECRFVKLRGTHGWED